MTSISTTTLQSLSAKTDDSKAKAADTYNQFLTLLTTQLQHQDPLDPMKSEEFTNQLVQFSQVEQAIISNDKLDTLLTQNNNDQISRSIGYIGKDVYYQGDSIYNAGQPVKIGFSIDGEAADANLRVYDADGQLIRTIEIPAGQISGSVTWDGTDDQGVAAATSANYTVRVDALDSESKALTSYTGVPGHVEGVETINGILYLALQGDGRIDATSVLSVSEPDATQTQETAT